MVEWRTTQVGDLPCVGGQLPSGDSVLVSLHGGHVLSWVCNGRERLFLSEKADRSGAKPIRGGVPICWPQFNQRGLLEKHGFARNMPWRLVRQSQLFDEQGGELVIGLRQDAHTLLLWPQVFELALRIRWTPNQLHLELSVANPGPTRLAFSGALHTYFAVDDVTQAQLQGLDGADEWNAVTDEYGQCQSPLLFNTEFDRVYAAVPHALTLVDGEHRLRIEQSASWGQTVVWTPGPALSAKLADMADDGWRRMLCVEAAQVYAPIHVAPEQTWVGAQTLTVLN